MHLLRGRQAEESGRGLLMRLFSVFAAAAAIFSAAHAQSSPDWHDGYTRWINGCPISPHQCNVRTRPAWHLLEADNGAVTAVDTSSIHYDGLNRFAYINAYQVQGEEFHPEYSRQFMFDCHGRFAVGSTMAEEGSWTYAPPRSIAAQIGALACVNKPSMCDAWRKSGITCIE
jgi:hypothetical protein